MKTSANGLEFLMQNEGCVLHVYDDGAGYPTIGVGHRVVEGDPDFSSGITKEEALDILARDVARFERAVNDMVEVSDLTQNQFDVLVDFSFNAGEGALEQLLSHGLDEVPNQLPRWVHAGGRVMPGLVKRRQREVELWNKEDV